METIATPWIWIGFSAFVLLMLALDLGVFHRKAHTVSLKESLSWTTVWIVLALLFNLGVWHYAGSQKALEFFTGYLIEKSLSVDNIFVFALLFSYFAVPAKVQHKVLFWGILGALLMRAVMIGAGTVLITRFTWIIYIFGAFLILTGIKMIVKRAEEIRPEQNPLVRWFRRWMPMTTDYREDRFVVWENGRRMATPLLLVLLLVEFTDLIFAVDSIPAIFAVTTDPFIVYTSNVFAILGLRSLYFALAGVMHKFHYLKLGLGVVLTFVGVKMLLAHTPYKIDTLVSLGVILGVLALSVIASLVRAGTLRFSSMKRAFVALIGGTVVLIGLALIVLPGPAFLVIPAGLAILATEFLWARRALRKGKGFAARVRRKGFWASLRSRSARRHAPLAGKAEEVQRSL